MRRIAVLTVFVLLIAACGTDRDASDEPTSTTVSAPTTATSAPTTSLAPPSDEPVGDLTPGPRGNTTITALPPLADPSGSYKLATFVIQDPSGPPVACMGGVAESLPPQCGGIALIGFNWSNVTFNEANGVRFSGGDVYLEGSFEGDAFRLTLNRDATADDRGPQVTRDLSAACPEPEGGWANVDPDLVSSADFDAAIAYADSIDDRSAVWVSQPAMSGPSPLEQIINVAVVANLELHETELRARWGGPLCVVEGLTRSADLRAVQTEIGDASAELGAVVISVNEIAGVVDVTVIVSDDGLEAEFASRWPGVTIDLDPVFRPLP